MPRREGRQRVRSRSSFHRPHGGVKLNLTEAPHVLDDNAYILGLTLTF